MTTLFLRRFLPLVALSGLFLTSCVVHERVGPPRERHHRGYYGRPGPPPGPRY